MTTESLLMISEQGVERWTINKQPLRINEPALLDNMSRNVVKKCDAVATVGGPFGATGVALKQGIEMWSVHVNSLSFECPFYLSDGVHTPAFADTNQPSMKLEWIPSMKVVLGITVLQDGAHRYCGDHYLIAFDSRGGMWRMPVSNLYEDGKLCHGQPATRFNRSLDCVLDCCKRFNNSKWNHDLYHASDEKRFKCTRDMFRWKPEEKGFTQLPMLIAASKDWTSLCQKIASETLQQIIQIV